MTTTEENATDTEAYGTMPHTNDKEQQRKTNREKRMNRNTARSAWRESDKLEDRKAQMKLRLHVRKNDRKPSETGDSDRPSRKTGSWLTKPNVTKKFRIMNGK